MKIHPLQIVLLACIHIYINKTLDYCSSVQLIAVRSLDLFMILFMFRAHNRMEINIISVQIWCLFQAFTSGILISPNKLVVD